ncbi:MAG: HEPN domain-containing protein [Ignavibacteriae bacterium]|nr:HEPN domain-containing protein [Ignavibacteriota bacterium]
MNEKIKNLALYRSEKSRNELQVSKELLDKNHFSQSINRSYYAIFHSARALLALIEFDSKKHSGIISFFIKNFVKQGLVDEKYSTIINKAQQIRINSDYDDFYIVTKEQAQNQYGDAKEFVKMTEVYLSSQGILIDSG